MKTWTLSDCRKEFDMRKYFNYPSLAIITGLLLVLALSACSVPVTGDPVNRIIDSEPVMPEVDANDPNDSTDVTSIPDSQRPVVTMTPNPFTQTPVMLFHASPTPPPTVTPRVTVTPPQFIDPHVITLRQADVRSGPGSHYDLYHTFNAGVSAPVQGRSTDGQWWAVPGPGDGPGPLGWIHHADVQFYGDIQQVVILPPNPGLPGEPQPDLGDWPVHLDPGSPPSNACVVFPAGVGMPLIRLGPGMHFGGAAYLGNWAEVLKSEMDWYMVHLGPGDTGWVYGQEVRLEGPCP
jgi:hypothetical protein